ncbi:MAG: LysM peptidoglycan-binding domain-containing protein [Thermomicrobiales bacterium]
MKQLVKDERRAETAVATGVEERALAPRRFDYGRGGTVVGGRKPRGARAPRAGLVVARLLPHLLVLAVAVAVVIGNGFWDPTLLGIHLSSEPQTPPDFDVPLLPPANQGVVSAEPEYPATSGYFTRPPLPITPVRLRLATYETKAGETPKQVAARFGLQTTTILWANAMQDPERPLPAGTKLRIPPVDGMLHQVQGNDTLTAIAAKYRVETTAITGYQPNDIAGPNDLVPNTFILVIGGQMPVRERIEEYVVRNGDTLWSIANRFGLEPSTLVWANSLTNGDVLAVGQPIIIPPVNGTIHHVEDGETLAAIAERYGVKPEQITAFAPNGLGGDGTPLPGSDLVIPGGTPPAPPPPVIAEPVQSDPAVAPPAAAPGSAPAATPASGTRAVGSFIWPATGALTTYFGDNPAYYGPGGHNGLDIANSLGTPLLAADGGVVIFSGWQGGLGNAIAIDHENGFVTWYGHANSLAVSAGQRVARGQVVAYMGSTGNSTGSHVHFIVVRNGVYVNPLAYLPR